MAANVQVWFYSGFAVGGAGDTPLPKEPPIGYDDYRDSNMVDTTNIAITVPGVAAIAVIETDAAVAYRVNSAASFANDPHIPATSNSRYVVDVSGAATLNLISGA